MRGVFVLWDNLWYNTKMEKIKTPESAREKIPTGDKEASKELIWLGGQVERETLDSKASEDKERAIYTPEQQEILNQLKSAKGSQARVEMYGKLMDDYGIDAMLGLAEGLGDGASSAVSGLYLAAEAVNAGLDKKAYLKIIALQTVDFGIGSIPIAGDVFDYFFKANKQSGKMFANHTEDIKKKARKLGISEEEIVRIDTAAEKLPQVAEKVVKITQEAPVGAEPNLNTAA